MTQNASASDALRTSESLVLICCRHDGNICSVSSSHITTKIILKMFCHDYDIRGDKSFNKESNDSVLERNSSTEEDGGVFFIMAAEEEEKKTQTL